MKRSGGDGVADMTDLRARGCSGWKGWTNPSAAHAPQFFWSLEWVQRVLADVEDYRRGSMGDVNDMEAPYLELLRVADSEKAKWKAEQEARIQEEVQKDAKK